MSNMSSRHDTSEDGESCPGHLSCAKYAPTNCNHLGSHLVWEKDCGKWKGTRAHAWGSTWSLGP